MPRGSVQCDFCQKTITLQSKRMHIAEQTQCMSCYLRRRRSQANAEANAEANADDINNNNEVNIEEPLTKKIKLSYRRYPFSKARYVLIIHILIACG